MQGAGTAHPRLDRNRGAITTDREAATLPVSCDSPNSFVTQLTDDTFFSGWLKDYGSTFELGNVQMRGLARLLSCVSSHPGGDPLHLCNATEMSLYTLSKSVDKNINASVETLQKERRF